MEIFIRENIHYLIDNVLCEFVYFIVSAAKNIVHNAPTIADLRLLGFAGEMRITGYSGYHMSRHIYLWHYVYLSFFCVSYYFASLVLRIEQSPAVLLSVVFFFVIPIII